LSTKTYANLTSSFEAEKYFTDNSGSLKVYSQFIAGEYTSSLSQSLKSDIALGVEAKNIFDSETILSSSTQIAVDITGSFNSVSSSLSNRIYNNEDTLLVSKSI
jgi:hypothetical protein